MQIRLSIQMSAVCKSWPGNGHGAPAAASSPHGRDEWRSAVLYQASSVRSSSMEPLQASNSSLSLAFNSDCRPWTDASADLPPALSFMYSTTVSVNILYRVARVLHNTGPLLLSGGRASLPRPIHRNGAL
jgi:hypothetical protein